MMASCARREQCSWDIEEKLHRFDLTQNDISQIIRTLEAQKFIDNERYAKAFVKDKMQFNQWGKNKIKYHLQAKRLPEELISSALETIKEDVYSDKLDEILRKKLAQLEPVEDYFKTKAKLIRYAASKGFEASAIYEKVDRLLG